VKPIAALLLLLSPLPALAAPTPAQAVTEIVDGTRATVVAFAPTSARDAQDDGLVEGLAHTRFALEDARRCLGERGIAYRLVFADRLRVDGGKRSVVYRGAQLGQGFGAVLVRPGQPPRLVVSRDGPSTLQELLPQAAAALWQAPACQPQP
jgi:hypothetical protein